MQLMATLSFGSTPEGKRILVTLLVLCSDKMLTVTVHKPVTVIQSYGCLEEWPTLDNDSTLPNQLAVGGIRLF